MKKDKKKKADENVLKSGESPENDFSDGEIESELRQPVWSVVSFEQCAAKNLTYDDAAKKIAELEKQGISGLCLVTDTVAERIAKG